MTTQPTQEAPSSDVVAQELAAADYEYRGPFGREKHRIITPALFDRILAALASTAGDTLKADYATVLKEIEQEWRWGNLTKLGVVNHLRRRGFKMEAAIEHAERLTALGSDQ